MAKIQGIAITAAALAVAVFFSCATCIVLRAPNLFLHLDGTLTRTEATISKANATLVNLDKATKSWADSEKAISGDFADTMTQARGTLSGAQEALQSVPGISQHLQGTADAATGLLASAQRTTEALPPMLGDMRAAIQGVPEVESAARVTLTDFDGLLTSKSLSDAIAGTAQTTQNVGKISGDLYVWSHPLLNPDPCTTAVCRWKRGFEAVGKLAGFTSSIEGAKTLFQPLSVKVSK